MRTQLFMVLCCLDYKEYSLCIEFFLLPGFYHRLEFFLTLLTLFVSRVLWSLEKWFVSLFKSIYIKFIVLTISATIWDCQMSLIIAPIKYQRMPHSLSSTPLSQLIADFFAPVLSINCALFAQVVSSNWGILCSISAIYVDCLN